MKIPIVCNYCNKTFLRSRRQVKEAEKFTWRQFCSKECHSKAKNKQSLLTCSNPKCQKKFKRRIFYSSKYIYCSRSCAASINNNKYPKIFTPIMNCIVCKKQFKSREKYCSVGCKSVDQIISKEFILEEIKNFYQKNGRIPLKREYHHYNAARKRFKNWNNTIRSAGLVPNPLMFSTKHKAKDGHICDSMAEKIIDDWLYARKINHKRSIPYPNNNNLHVDFVVQNYWIEFFGLHGQHRRYDELRKEKLKIVKKYNLNFIEIYPRDLFPDNKLAQILIF